MRFPNSIVMRGLATSYSHMMDILSDHLDLIAYEMAIDIEKQGGVAVPVPSGEPYYDWDPDRRHGRGDLSHKHAAQAAGLGRLGKNSLLITPESGNRVELVSIVANLDLEPDPLVEKELCPSKCMICIKSCPVNAIAGKQQVNQKICRSHMLRVFGTLQDRLVKEMRLAGVRTCAEANRFLDVYLPEYNRRFMKDPLRPQDLHRPVLKSLNGE